MVDYYSGISRNAVTVAPIHEMVETAPLINRGIFSVVDNETKDFSVEIFERCPIATPLIISASTNPIFT